MPKHGKKYMAALAKVDRDNLYNPADGVALAKETSVSKFDSTVEVHVRLGVDPRHADQQVRDVVVLPHGLGKTVRVLVFAQGEGATWAREAGADVVADDDETFAKIQGGWLDFDVAVATPDLMGKVGRLGRILGPRGLMPNPKVGTVTFEIGRAVDEAKSGKIEYRVEKAGIVHAPVGKASFEVDKLKGNLVALMDALIKAKPSTAKGTYLKKVTVSATMGPGVNIDVPDLQALVK